jgi:hypothetical protein
MKKLIILFLGILLSTIGFSQSTVNPDTVCYQTNGSFYSVPNTPGYTYTWTVVAPGVLIAGQGTNQITVDWSLAAPGLIPNAITVYATNQQGCQSPVTTLNVFIFNITPVITPIGPFCENAACVDLVGLPLGGTWGGQGIVNNQFCPQNVDVGSPQISYIINQGGCSFVTTYNVTVNPVPSISPIEHD